MNRKLHNTVTALFATSGLLALTLLAAHPLQVQAPAAPQVAGLEATARGIQLSAGLSTQATTLAAIAAAFDGTPAVQAAQHPTLRPVHRSHRGRQSVAMPFFSFFPKG